MGVHTTPHAGPRDSLLDLALAEPASQGPEVDAAAVVSTDGLPMAAALPALMSEDRVAAMSAALLALAGRASEGLDRGRLFSVYIEGENGTVVVMSCDDEAVLVALAPQAAQAGMIRYEVRRTAQRVAEILRDGRPATTPSADRVADKAADAPGDGSAAAKLRLPPRHGPPGRRRPRSAARPGGAAFRRAGGGPRPRMAGTGSPDRSRAGERILTGRNGRGSQSAASQSAASQSAASLWAASRRWRTGEAAGQVLIDEGLVSTEQLQVAIDEQQRLGRSLGRIMVDHGMVSESQLVAALATQIGLRFVDITDYPVDGSAVPRLPEMVSRRHQAIAIGHEDGKLVVAMADPANVFALDDIRSITGMDVRQVVATKADVLAAINRYHRADSDLDDLSTAMDARHEEDDLSKIKEVTEDAPIVKFVNLLITQAIQDRASDIHIEPAERDLRVRFRIDGVLHEIMRSPKAIQSGVISRLKIMAEINIAERRIPQDGRLSVTSNGKKVDLRVATLPTVWGEKVVMRILDNSTAQYKLSDLGFVQGNYDRYSQSFTKPYGMILVTGPTGSGKSTTLYATLNIVSKPEVNVITVEDPVEYRLAGINQVQVNNKAGLTFASALRSILRSDPDVVLIGEIRDHETAQIAIEAALTGHLVLATLHTNDSPSAITRLVEMGIEPFLVGSAIDCVLAQRLARRLCGRCKEPYSPTPEALVHARFPWEPGRRLPTLHRAVGCSACSKTGYKGRVALHEVMTVSEEVERLAVERASAAAIGAVAREQGMVTLRRDGMEKVRDGITSIEEILRVVV